MIIKVHYNAAKHLQKLLDSDMTKSKTIRITSNGYSWGGINWDIVLDEQKDNDVVCNDKGFKILVADNLAKFFSVATIEYKQTFAGYKFVIK